MIGFNVPDRPSKAPPPPNGGFSDDDHLPLWEAIWQTRIDLTEVKSRATFNSLLLLSILGTIIGLAISRIL